MLPIIADNKGYFKELGLDLHPNYVRTGKIAMDATVSGDLDFGVIVETNIAFVKFQEGANINVITKIIEKYDDAIVARRDRGINTPKDLEGQTLAILPGTTSQRFADLFIDFHKLDRNKISYVNLSPPGIQAAIMTDNIAAGSIWQPYRYNVVEEIGEKAIEFNNESIYKAYALVAVRKEFAEKNAEKIQRFLRALIKAEQFVRDNKDESIAILAKELNIEPKVLAAVWDDYDLSVRLDPALQEVLIDEGKWIQQTQKGFAEKSLPSYADVVDSSFLQAVDSKRIVAAQ